MSLESVKSIVARAHKDPEFKQKLSSHRDEVLSEYDLTVEERSAIARLGLSFDSKGSVDPMVPWA